MKMWSNIKTNNLTSSMRANINYHLKPYGRISQQGTIAVDTTLLPTTYLFLYITVPFLISFVFSLFYLILAATILKA